MKSKRYEGKDTRIVLGAMIMDRITLARIAKNWSGPGLFDAPYANLVGSWCVKYLNDYGEPPGLNIRTVYENWAQSKRADRDTDEAIRKLLVYVFDDWKNDKVVNSGYYIDLAGDLFNRAKIRKVISEVQDDLDENDIKGALSKLSNVSRVELGVGSVSDPAEDFDIWERAFDQRRNASLVRYGGALGYFFRGAFTRDRFISFMAPDKSQKSYILLDVAYRAARNNSNVAYFEVGDLSVEEIYIRLGQRAAGLPLYDKTVCLPTSIRKVTGRRCSEDDEDFGRSGNKQVRDGRRGEENDQEGSEREAYKLTVKDVRLEGITDAIAFKAFRQACRSSDSFRVSSYPNSTISADDIYSILLEWKRSGWVPDVCVIDYADILAPPKGIKDTLDQIDETWKRLQKISHSVHCCVVTASQSNAAAYRNSDGYLSKKHFSGRKTKLAHVDGMVGINITDEDRANGVLKFNWIVRRNARYIDSDLCYVAGCLDIGRPTIVADY